MRVPLLAGIAVALAVLVTVTLAASRGRAMMRHHPLACPTPSERASLPLWRAGGLLRGDIDGDGRRDAVSIRFARFAPARCAFSLRVSTASGATYTRSLGPWIWDIGKSDYNARVRTWYWSTPNVGAIVDLGRRGNLIVLLDNSGAANDFGRFVALDSGRLQEVPIGGRVLTFGGSATDMTSVQCALGGPLRILGVDNVQVSKHPNRWGWQFSSVTYRKRGPRFVAVKHRREIGSNAKTQRLGVRAGMRKPSFSGCSIARNPDFY